MKLIKPSFEIIEQQPGLAGVYKQIELAGRTCYKSEDKITEDSAKGFVDRMIASGHGAMLEHGTVYLKRYSSKEDNLVWVEKYALNPYSRISYGDGSTRIDGTLYNTVYITTNLRVLVENSWMDDLKYVCEPTEYHEKRITVRFTCDRGVSHEFVRHRVFSFAQESTRYCDYTSRKFSNECTFIIPCWTTLEPGLYEQYDDENYSYYPDDYTDCERKMQVDKDWNTLNPQDEFLTSVFDAEYRYRRLRSFGWTAQQARTVLPNSLKTELVMTGFVSDWWGRTNVIKDNKLVRSISNSSSNLEDEIGEYDSSYRIVRNGFFGLRCASSAHPQAQELAIPLREEFIKRNYLN